MRQDSQGQLHSVLTCVCVWSVQFTQCPHSCVWSVHTLRPQSCVCVWSVAQCPHSCVWSVPTLCPHSCMCVCGQLHSVLTRVYGQFPHSVLTRVCVCVVSCTVSSLVCVCVVSCTVHADSIMHSTTNLHYSIIQVSLYDVFAFLFYHSQQCQHRDVL